MALVQTVAFFSQSIGQMLEEKKNQVAPIDRSINPSHSFQEKHMPSQALKKSAKCQQRVNIPLESFPAAFR